MVSPQFYGVTTTKIFCRFGCPSKTPRAENVVFFDTVAGAERDGFRSCKRCRPDKETSPTLEFERFVTTQTLAIARSHPDYRIDDIAQELSLSRRQLERIVRRATGHSPRAYIRSTMTDERCG